MYKISSETTHSTKESPEFESKIIRRAKQALTDTTIHGIKPLIKSEHHLLKIVWISLMLFSISYSSYLMIQEVFAFLTYPVVSLTRVEYVQTIDLPIITICNLNPFATKYARETVLTLQNNQLFDKSNDSRILKYVNAKYYVPLNAWTNINESKSKMFGLSLNQSLISCIFDWEECSLDQDFFEFYDPFYGNCFRYNFKMNKKVAFSGSMYGLQLQLASNQMESQNSLLSIYSGFTVYISDHSSINTLFTDGVKIPLGFLTDIIVSKLVITKQPKPYSECVKDLTQIDSYPSETYKKTFIFNNKTYTREDCMNMCFQIFLIKNCGCYDIGNGGTNDFTK
jgi:hypothetical protein